MEKSNLNSSIAPAARLVGGSEYQRLLWAALAGLVVTLGLPPVPWTGLLVPLGLAWFFVQLPGAERPARLAWVFGFAHQLSLLHWLFFLIPAKTIPTRALVPLQAVAAILYVSVFYLVFGWLVGLVRRRVGAGRLLLLIPVLYTAMEILRDRGELAFPWCLTGSVVSGTPLMVLLRTSGEMGVGAAIIFSAAALAALWLRQGCRRLLTPVAAGLWAVLALGALVDGGAAAGAPVRISAIQADVSLDEKWDPARRDATTVPYTELTRQAAADSSGDSSGGPAAGLVVWAETAIPAYVRYDRDLMDWVRDLARDQHIWLYTGFPDARRNEQNVVEKFNSSGLFNDRGILVDRYAKHHLLPIGEAMPFTRYFPALARIDVGQAEWTPGPPPNVMTAQLPDGPLAFSGLICFESILGRLARRAVGRGSTCLVVLTNDGWFGQTAGPRQHTALALLRAAESNVPLVRCANNGISLICDTRGRVLDRLGLGHKGVVSAAVTPGSGGTLFVRLGIWPLVVFLLVFGLAVLARPDAPRKD